MIFVRVRPPHCSELHSCKGLVARYWGRDAAERCHDQFVECFKGGKYAPDFFVAASDDGKDSFLGFAAVHRTMQCTHNIIWLAVNPDLRGKAIGRHLLGACLQKTDDQDCTLVEVISQERAFYQKHGFFQVRHLGSEWYLMLKPLGEFGL